MSSPPSVTMPEALRQCQKCGIAPPAYIAFARCGRCRAIRYCSKECQQSDWTRHKAHCLKTSSSSDSSSSTFTSSRDPTVTSSGVNVSLPWPQSLVGEPVTAPLSFVSEREHVESCSALSLPDIHCELRDRGTSAGVGVFVTRSYLAGDIVMRETTTIMGSDEELVEQLACTRWTSCLYPRDNVALVQSPESRAQYEETMHATPHLSSESVERALAKIQYGAFALSTESLVSAVASGDYSAKPDSRKAILPVAQFMNHACNANTFVIVSYNTHCAVLVAYATRDIAVGEELTHSYDIGMSKTDLKRKYGFDCVCESCIKSGCDDVGETKFDPKATIDRWPPVCIDAIVHAATTGFALESHVTAESAAKARVPVNSLTLDRLVVDASHAFAKLLSDKTAAATLLVSPPPARQSKDIA